jgi:hypothetical protein
MTDPIIDSNSWAVAIRPKRQWVGLKRHLVQPRRNGRIP